MTGDLTIKGITKPADFKVVLKGEARDPMTQEQLYIFSIAGIVNRFDYGIGEEFLDFVISDQVFLEASVILKKKRQLLRRKINIRPWNAACIAAFRRIKGLV